MATYSLYTGSGPALVSYSGPFQSGIAFQVTEGGCWFNAYRWWVPAGGDTAAQKFALWCLTVEASTGNALVSGSVITSGALTANAWNLVTLATPVQLAPGAAYVACTGWTVLNGFPDTNNQFASGDPFSAGITSGPLFAYSDSSAGGTGPTLPLGMPQGQFSANSGATDPSVYMPAGESNSANFGIDVQVSDTAPSGYAGSYRIWPNFAAVGPQNNNQVDSNQAYSLGTEFTLSQACTLDNLWFYSPGAATQLPTQCAVWNVGTQAMVSGTLKTSPGWSGAAGSGWVSASYSGVTLPAGDYKTSVWNASASGTGTGWNEYTVNYFTTGVGVNGIVSGPVTVPNVTSATSPGQSTYATSTTTFLYPNTYVATEGQSYWVDVEVTPVTAVVPPPVAPPAVPPGRMSPMAFQWQAPPPAPSVPPPVTVSAAAALSGSGALSPAGSVQFTSAAVLAGTGTLAAAETGTFPVAVALAGSGSLAAQPVLTSASAAALSGTGTLTAPRAVQFTSAAVLSGSGALTSAGVVTQPAAASLSGSGTLAAARTVTWQHAASLAGSGTLGALGVVTQPAAAALSGSGTLTAEPSVQFTSACVLSGAGSLAAAVLEQFASASALAGTGTLAASGLVTQPASAALSGSGSLGAGVLVAFTAAAALSGSGTLTAAALVTQPAGAALSGSGTLTAAGSVSGLAQGSAALSGTGSLAAGVSAVLFQAAALSGSGAFAVSALVTVPASSVLSGSGVLAVAVSVTVSAAAMLSGMGTLAAAAVAASPTGVSLSGAGSLTAGASLVFAAAALLSGTGTITVAAQVILPVTEPSVAWSASPAAPRWRCAPFIPRWRVTMAIFRPISALSLECVNVLWNSDLDGTVVDPTGQASGQPELPVYFAFPPTSGDYSAPAEPITWYTAAWLLGGTGRGYIAQALVGPGGGVVTLTAGQPVDVWSRVTGDPEVPAKFAGTLPVY